MLLFPSFSLILIFIPSPLLSLSLFSFLSHYPLKIVFMVLQKCGIVFDHPVLPKWPFWTGEEGGRKVALGRKEGGREVGRKKDRRKHRKYNYNNLLCVLHSIVLTVGILLVMESISSAFLQALCLHW